MPEMSREFFFPKKLSLSFEKEMSRVLFLILDRSEKAAILSSLIKKTNALEMKWLLMIILKGVISLPILLFCEISYSFAAILQYFALHRSTCFSVSVSSSLLEKKVCQVCHDSLCSKRHPGQWLFTCSPNLF